MRAGLSVVHHIPDGLGRTSCGRNHAYLCATADTRAVDCAACKVTRSYKADAAQHPVNPATTAIRETISGVIQSLITVYQRQDLPEDVSDRVGWSLSELQNLIVR